MLKYCLENNTLSFVVEIDSIELVYTFTFTNPLKTISHFRHLIDDDVYEFYDDGEQHNKIAKHNDAIGFYNNDILLFGFLFSDDDLQIFEHIINDYSKI